MQRGTCGAAFERSWFPSAYGRRRVRRMGMARIGAQNEK